MDSIKPQSVRGSAAPACVLALVALVACGSSGGVEPPEVRVVLITIDTLRHDALAQMPLLRARARTAVQFKRFYAATSTTQPSHASMFTGLHPWEHGVTRNGHVLAAEYSTLAEKLAKAGFETRAVVGAFPVAARFGFGQGFAHYSEEFERGFFGMLRWGGEDVPQRKFFSGADHVSTLALREIERAEGDRQFFWFHYFDPHSPYGSSAGGELSAQEIRDAVSEGGSAASELLAEARRLYATDLAFLDRELERLFARLYGHPGDDGVETHVMLVSDHGESFGEGQSVSHSYRLIDSQLRVPAFIWSSAVGKGERWEVAGSIDVMPTILSLVGVGGSGGGRDLTQAGASEIAVYGMRQTFKAGSDPKEQRLDGELVSLDGLLFYAVGSEGIIRRGNGDGMENESVPALVDLFRSFEAELSGRVAPQIPADVERALEQLGYTQ